MDDNSARDLSYSGGVETDRIKWLASDAKYRLWVVLQSSESPSLVPTTVCKTGSSGTTSPTISGAALAHSQRIVRALELRCVGGVL
ncbi:hypothetical protein SCLCIDRAFT_1221058 [Scleroderma citrinum Foug A]|uniref:Uncharacterized protein n=1 Tax=Scleroderma citrinum Foug A TaxID=1036808 RepID=A0A0C3DHF5_9AGAM|nr:hypothetical protein SCLCIDRAFT_1221058 [Scleroderma citrinum Foug A]